jgi:hypothetical protein
MSKSSASKSAREPHCICHLSSDSSRPIVCNYKRQLEMLEKTSISWLILPELNSSSTTRIAMAFKLALLLAVVAFASVVSPNLFALTITIDVHLFISLKYFLPVCNHHDHRLGQWWQRGWTLVERSRPQCHPQDLGPGHMERRRCSSSDSFPLH